MIREVNEIKFLFLCQSSDWQCIIEAENEETAATMAIESIMTVDEVKDRFSLSNSVAVKKIQNNLFQESEESETIFFYAPMILANAGFHSEAKVLEQMIENDRNLGEGNE